MYLLSGVFCAHRRYPDVQPLPGAAVFHGLPGSGQPVPGVVVRRGLHGLRARSLPEQRVGSDGRAFEVGALALT